MAMVIWEEKRETGMEKTKLAYLTLSNNELLSLNYRHKWPTYLFYQKFKMIKMYKMVQAFQWTHLLTYTLVEIWATS